MEQIQIVIQSQIRKSPLKQAKTKMFNTQNDDLQAFKKKRQEYIINIRRNNREEIFNKRRNIIEDDNQLQESKKQQNVVDLNHISEIRQLHQLKYSEDHLNDYIAMVSSTDYLTILQGIIGIRNIIDLEQDQKGVENNIVVELIKKGVMKKLVNFLNFNDQPQLKHQSIYALSIITYTKNSCAELIKYNIIPLIVKMIQQHQVFTVNHAIVTVGNIAADNVKYRDLLLKGGTLQSLYQIINSKQKMKLPYLNSIWGLSNLCRGTPLPKYSQIDSVIPIFCRQMTNQIFKDLHKCQISQVYSDILWTLSMMAEQSKARADRIIQSNALPIIVGCLLNKNKDIYFPAIKIIGSLAVLGEKQSVAVLNSGFLQIVVKLLEHPKKIFRRELCWTLSNIACGTSQQIQKLINRKDILDKISQMFRTQEPGIKQEICWIYHYLGFLDDKKKVIQLYLYYDIMKVCVDLLDEKNIMLLQSVLKCLYRIFLVANKTLIDGNNIMLMKFMEYGGVQKISKLQEHQSTKIYNAVVQIMKKFFEVEVQL